MTTINRLSPVARITDNPILVADSYKASHYRAYPDNTKRVYSYIESRGGRWDKALFVGPQMYVKSYLRTRVTKDHIDEAEDVLVPHGLPFNRPGWERILNKHGGYMPVSIRAVPEGMVVPTKNILVSIENTDEELPWVTSYLETSLLRAVWYPTTVGTLSWHIKQRIRDALELSCDDPASVLPFRLHDFGGRGVSSGESAAIGGLAHLVNFMGTDTLEALVTARRFYGEQMAGYSIPAGEHSTITTWGREGETAAYLRMIESFAKPGTLVAAPSDSYDLWNAVNNIWGDALKQRVIDSGATIVVRPDSGDPTTVPVQVIENLMEKFGFTVNKKGYRVLPNCVRVIQGDGMSEDSIAILIASLLKRKISLENIAFGMGGKLLQGVDRDTLRFAQKASAAKFDDAWVDVYKDPITDPGKASKRGRMALIREEGFATVPRAGNDWRDIMMEIYRDGEEKVDWTLQQMRDRSNEVIC